MRRMRVAFVVGKESESEGISHKQIKIMMFPRLYEA